MFGIENPRLPDPNSLEEQLQPYVDKVQRELDALRLQQALDFLDSISEDEPDNLPARDESRIVDLSHPRNWHDAIDLLQHLAELGNRTKANQICAVLTRAFDSAPEIRDYSGADWALVICSLVERFVLTASSMPSPLKN